MRTATLTAVLSLAWLLASDTAIAQNAAAAKQAKQNAPGLQVPPGQNLTQEQMQQIMILRGLQSRSRGQVRTGTPQIVPFGGPMMGPMMGGPMMGGPDFGQLQQPAEKTSAQKRFELQEERKRAEREKAEAKKAKAGKNAKAPPANAKGKAAATDKDKQAK